MENKLEKIDNLDKLESIMMEELDFYSDKEKSNSSKSSRLNITDRIVKSAGVILAIENLKERRFMNRTERRSEIRKINQVKKD